MKILIAGARGLIGTALTEAFQLRGDVVVTLGRSGSSSIVWSPEEGELDTQALKHHAPYDVVYNLAGESILPPFGFWTESHKERIRMSRVAGTALLVESLAKVAPPAVYVGASAVGIYGNTAGPVDESEPPGDTFLASVGAAWESATSPIALAGSRLVLARIGVVLTPQGGMLKTLLTPFRLGLGGPLGDGRHILPWISLTDVVRSLVVLGTDTRFSGPVNLVAPHPVTNEEFTKALAHYVNRPAIFRAPKWILTTLLGSFAREVMFADTNVAPKRLAEFGFRFEHPSVEEFFQSIRDIRI